MTDSEYYKSIHFKMIQIVYNKLCIPKQKTVSAQRLNSFNAGGLPPVALRTSKQLSHHAA